MLLWLIFKSLTARWRTHAQRPFRLHCLSLGTAVKVIGGLDSRRICRPHQSDPRSHQPPSGPPIHRPGIDRPNRRPESYYSDLRPGYGPAAHGWPRHRHRSCFASHPTCVAPNRCRYLDRGSPVVRRGPSPYAPRPRSRRRFNRSSCSPWRRWQPESRDEFPATFRPGAGIRSAWPCSA
jgi:hypothetical protein